MLKRDVFRCREAEIRLGQFLSMIKRPPAVIEAVALFPTLAQGSHQKAFGTTRIDKDLRFVKKIAKPGRRFAEKAGECVPMVALLPVALVPVFEIVGVIPVARDGNGRLKIG